VIVGGVFGGVRGLVAGGCRWLPVVADGLVIDGLVA
jgi:hypothetical protein